MLSTAFTISVSATTLTGLNDNVSLFKKTDNRFHALSTVILADEPTSALDPISAKLIEKQLSC